MKTLPPPLLALGLVAALHVGEPHRVRSVGPKPSKDIAMQELDTMIQQAAVDTTQANWKTRVPRPTALAFDRTHQYFAHLQTNKGTVVIRFLPEVAPMHVSSFMYLTRLGFYDGLAFHRVIQGFMAQGGDPIGNGSGGPGYEFDGEFSPTVKHDRPGLLSMANRGPGTDGSQFFLTFVPTPWLDGKHTIFGEVVAGQDVLALLEASGSANGHTKEALRMEKVTLEVK